MKEELVVQDKTREITRQVPSREKQTQLKEINLLPIKADRIMRNKNKS